MSEATKNDPMKVLREAKLDAAESILNRLEGWDKAYPLDVFPEPTDEEREWLHENKRGLMDRIAASMGRHMAKCIREDIAALQAAIAALGGEQAKPEELVIGAARVYGGEWFRELTWRGVMFLAPLDEEEKARHALAILPPPPGAKERG